LDIFSVQNKDVQTAVGVIIGVGVGIGIGIEGHKTGTGVAGASPPTNPPTHSSTCDRPRVLEQLYDLLGRRKKVKAMLMSIL
jgi:hypothetical protein